MTIFIERVADTPSKGGGEQVGSAPHCPALSGEQGDLLQPKMVRLYHVARARAELDSSYRATRPEAAAIHLRLSAMHLQQARALGEKLPEPSARDFAWLEEFSHFHGQWLNAISLDRPLRPNDVAGNGESGQEEAAGRSFYHEGRRDRARGASRGGCPHAPGTAEAGAWLNGWDDEEEAGAGRPLLGLQV